jgi:hypothetical protein
MRSVNVTFIRTETYEVIINHEGILTDEEARDLFWDAFYNDANLWDSAECVQCSTDIRYITLFDENGNEIE